MESIRGFLGKYANFFSSLTVITSAITLWLGENGCLSTGDFAATCNISWLPVWLMPWITGLFIALTAFAKLTRPGGFLRSVFGSTAVVVPDTSSKSGPGTVTPQQVAEK